MLGPFPWDPFPPGEPDPKGPDPVQAASFRAAITAADAYRSVRLVLRRESGSLRVGNRFVADGRYREVAFFAAGNAASSMALAALHVFGDRLTQGFLASPEPIPPELPFRAVRTPPGFGPASTSPEAIAAAFDMVADLRDGDLFLVLLSPGANRALVAPPPGLTADEFGHLLASAHAAGATSAEVGLLARVLGTGAAGGRLAARIAQGDVATFLVDRGDGAARLGGGPMRPVAAEERTEARALADRIGVATSLPPPARALLATDAPSATVIAARPVRVAGPTDALRAAADAAFDRGWTSRLAFLDLPGPPEDAADRFAARTEELLRAEPLRPDGRTKGLAAFAMLTLEVPEGADDLDAFQRFLVRTRETLRRREMSVGLFRTAGSIGSPQVPAGAVLGAPTDPDAKVPRDRMRAVGMRAGITDVGLLAIALCPAPTPPKNPSP